MNILLFLLLPTGILSSGQYKSVHVCTHILIVTLLIRWNTYFGAIYCHEDSKAIGINEKVKKKNHPCAYVAVVFLITRVYLERLGDLDDLDLVSVHMEIKAHSIQVPR